ncbi:hypothetical protein KSF_000430 [Reticulibacter mediterranei]|uniref:Uncharacterized protein n=1 Tax=Reticulibacter mediterranei TaxID=2778369 RepID=A0A8J3MZA4_9CHLR|nr:hypothetical protein KSF_000430 [Reticulibacter mediterranei]
MYSREIYKKNLSIGYVSSVTMINYIAGKLFYARDIGKVLEFGIRKEFSPVFYPIHLPDIYCHQCRTRTQCEPVAKKNEAGEITVKVLCCSCQQAGESTLAFDELLGNVNMRCR